MHNPNAADGCEGFRQFIAFLRNKYPASHSTIVKSFVDGDFVILHVHTQQGHCQPAGGTGQQG